MGNKYLYPIPTSDYTVAEATNNGLTINFTKSDYVQMILNHVACGKIPMLVFLNDSYFGVCENYFINKSTNALAVSYFQSSNQWTPSISDKSLPLYFLIEN